jgi:hypothetical protein
MMQPRFPVYDNAAIAARWGCFSCHTRLHPDSLHKEDYAKGKGQYRMTCQACGMSIWFDLAPKEEQHEHHQ